MSAQTRILFVDDEEETRRLFYETMANEALLIETVPNGREALKKLKTFSADIVITDVVMAVMDGLTLLEEVRMQYPEIPVLMVLDQDSREEEAKFVSAGANDFIYKPFDFDAITSLIEKTTSRRKILKNKYKGKERRRGYRFENIIGQDPKMFRIFEEIVDVADTHATVLINGETGTGKELIADAIHFKSARKGGPFIKMNCGAFTETLINSELFGHEKGAFTGAITQKKGYFELAEAGSIFLDEIGTIPNSTQVSLLRVLESGAFQRVGGTRPMKVDTRVICATNMDLSSAVEQKLFRQDLFYRINVVSIDIPPLRERKSDIPLLANHFLKKYSAGAKKTIRRFSNAAMEMLIRHDWPGNVRELTNVVERAVIYCKGREITPDNLRKDIRKPFQAEQFTLTLSSMSLHEAESVLIRKALEETKWSIRRAAKLLCIARGTLYSKMKRYNIEKVI